MTREETIRRINENLQQLPEDYVAVVGSLVEQLRAQFAKDAPSEPTGQSETLPFVDEIERVREQSRRGLGPDEERQFT